MQTVIQNAIQHSIDLEDIKKNLFKLFRQLRKNEYQNIGYVSGIITSNGPQHISKNLKMLEKYTTELRRKHNYPIFSATDIFSQKIFEQINAQNLTTQNWNNFWKELIGHPQKYISHIFMTPGWKQSQGAKQEHLVAKKNELQIIYLKPSN